MQWNSALLTIYHNLKMLNLVTISTVLFIASTTVHIVNPQNTNDGSSGATSCQYLDTEAVYSVEILKHREQLACGTAGGGAGVEVCAGQRDTLAVAMAEMADLEADISRLLATTGDLSDKLLQLEQEFSAVQQALDSPTAAGKTEGRTREKFRGGGGGGENASILYSI